MALPNYTDRPTVPRGMTSFASADTRPNNHPVSPASGYGYFVGTAARYLGEGTVTFPKGFREQVYKWTLPSIDEYIKMMLGGNLAGLAAKVFAENPEFLNAFPTPAEWKAQLDPAFECFGGKIKEIVDEAWAGTLDTTVIQKLAELDALLTSILNEVFPTAEEIANAVEEALQEVKTALQSLCSTLNGQSDAIISAMMNLVPALTQALLELIPTANEAWHSIYDPIRNIIPTATQISDAIVSPLSEALPSATEISDSINKVVDAVGVQLGNVSQQILNQLQSAIPNAEALVVQMVQAFITAFPTQAQIMSAAEGAVKGVIDSAVNGIADQIANLISGTIPQMFPSLSQLLPGAVNVIGGAIGQFCNIVQSAAGSIISAVQTAMALINALPVILCTPAGISTVISAASSTISSAVSALNSISIPSGIAPSVTVAAGNALQFGAGIAAAISAMFSGLASSMSGLFNGLNLGNSIASAVFSAVSPLYNIPETALNNIINTIKQNLAIVESLANTVVNIARTAMAGLKTALSGVFNAVDSLFAPLVAVVTTIMARLSALLSPLLHPENLVNTISSSILASFKPNYSAILAALLSALSPLSQIITSLGAIWDQLQVIVARLASRLISILNGLFNFDGVIDRIKAIFNSFFKDWLDAPDIIKQTWSCLCDVLPQAIENLFFKEGRPLSISFLEALFRRILEPLIAPAREVLRKSLEAYWNGACMYPPTSSGSVYMHTEELGLTYKCLAKTAFKIPRSKENWDPSDRFIWTIKTSMTGSCQKPKAVPFYFMVPSLAPDPIKFMASFINALAKSTFKLIETLLCETIDGSLANIFEKVFKRIYKDLAELTSTTIASAGRVAGKLLELAVSLSEGMSRFVSETFGQITAKSFSTIIEIADFITSCAYKLLVDVIKSGLPRIISESIKGLWNAITRAIPNYIASAALAPMAAACDILNSITGGILGAVVKFFRELAPGLAQALINSSVHLITETVPKLVGEITQGVASVLKDINFNLWKSIPLTVYQTFKDMFPRAIAGAVGASFCMSQALSKSLAQGVGGLFSKAFGAFGNVFTGSLSLGAFDFSALASALSKLTEQIINCLLKLMPAVGQLASLGIAGAVKVASFLDSLLPSLTYFTCPPGPIQKTISYCDGDETKQIIVLAKEVAPAPGR